jgi:allophanate hydrolase
MSRAGAVVAAMRGAGPDPADPWSRSWEPSSISITEDRALRVGVADTERLDFDGDRSGPGSYRYALDQVDAIGADRVPIDVEPFLAAGRLLYGGAFVAERYAAVGEFIAKHRDEVDPVVAEIIVASADLAGWEVYRDLAALERVRQQTASMWSEVDVLILPTVPRIPTVAEARLDRVAPSVMLGRFTNFVNLLDLCALTVPLGPAAADGPPVSVTLIAPPSSDDLLVEVGTRLTAVASSERSGRS